MLFHESFDWAYSYGMTNSELVVDKYGTLRESWSGLALQRSGAVPPFIVPALDVNGHTNVASDAESAVRFWLTPYWSSRSLGGSGPGRDAVLCQLVVADDQELAVVWSLQATPDGSALVLLAPGEGGVAELLCADISWDPAAHCIGLNFGPDGGSALFVDGVFAAKGESLGAVPPKVAGLVFGSAWSGNASAEGDLEEVCVLGGPLTEATMAFYYATHEKQAALGPMSEGEWEAQRELAAKWWAERQAALAASDAGIMLLAGGASTCLTNVPVHLTNIVCAFVTNQGWTVTFQIQGGTNGLWYDVFTTTNLTGNSITNSQWTWLEQGPTCSVYQYTNQPGSCAFYVLGTPLDSDGDSLTDAFERLVSKTDPNNPDSDADGLADGWEWANRLNPLVDDSGQQASRANYTYDPAGRLRAVSGARSEAIQIDAEGNVTQVCP